MSTFAGDGTAGYQDGPGAAARFDRPIGVAVDASGNVFVAEHFGHRIRVVTPEGVVSTLAGCGEAAIDATGLEDGNGQGTATLFRFPSDIAVDSPGNIFVCDTLPDHHGIRKITPQGAVTTVFPNAPSGPGTSAGFDDPCGVAVDREGNIFVADCGTHRIFKVTPGGSVSTLAGGGTDGNTDGDSGFQDGPGADALFNTPAGIAVDGDGNVFVAGSLNRRIRRVTPEGIVSTIAGSGEEGDASDGTGTAAGFYAPNWIMIDPDGNIIVTDDDSHSIRKIAAGLTPPPGPRPAEEPSNPHLEENQSSDPTFSDVAFVEKHEDDQAGG